MKIMIVGFSYRENCRMELNGLAEQVTGFAESDEVIYAVISGDGELGRDPRVQSECIERYITLLKPDLVVLPSDITSKQAAVRVGVALGIPVITDLIKIECKEKTICGKRLAYSGHMVMEYSTADLPLIISLNIQKTESEAPAGQNVELPAEESQKEWLKSSFISIDTEDKDNVATARKLLVGGLGLKKSKIPDAMKAAEMIGAAYGTTRPGALDNGLPSKHILGMSGSKASADVCLILGASGMSAFVEGIVNCGKIIGVNTDENASLFKYCDYGVVGDCNEFVDLLMKEK